MMLETAPTYLIEEDTFGTFTSRRVLQGDQFEQDPGEILTQVTLETALERMMNGTLKDFKDAA